MEKIWLQIKAFYTNLPSKWKIGLSVLVTQILGQLSADIVSGVIYIPDPYKWYIGTTLGGIYNILTNYKLRFTNEDVEKVEASKTINIESSIKTTPVDITIT